MKPRVVSKLFLRKAVGRLPAEEIKLLRDRRALLLRQPHLRPWKPSGVVKVRVSITPSWSGARDFMFVRLPRIKFLERTKHYPPLNPGDERYGEASESR